MTVGASGRSSTSTRMPSFGIPPHRKTPCSSFGSLVGLEVLDFDGKFRTCLGGRSFLYLGFLSSHRFTPLICFCILLIVGLLRFSRARSENDLASAHDGFLRDQIGEPNGLR